MMPLILMALSALADTSLPVAEAPAPPIRLWVNSSRQFREGERARVQVETRDDGYLIVFNYDTDGRLRVLFPVDPQDDPFVRGGRRYEIRGRGDRESFMVGKEGHGLVYAAVAADPFRTEEIEAAGNWDYTRLNLGRDSGDPEADITDLLQRMTTDRGFDYDALDYRVYGYRDRYIASSWWYPRPYGYWDDYCDPYWRPSLFGCRYYPAGGWYFGYTGGYGYGYGGYYGGGWYDPWYRNRYYVPTGGRNRYPILAGRPRGYSIIRRDGNNPGSNGFARPGSFGGSSFGGGNRGGIDNRPRGGIERRPGERPNDGVAPRGPDRTDNQPMFERPRGRRVPPPEDRAPIIERDRGQPRGPVDFGGDRPRGADRPSVERERPQMDRPQYERPQVDRERPQFERPRDTERPRAEPARREPPPRVDPPRRDPPPRVDPPRNNPPPSSNRGSGGGGGGRPHRP